MKYNRDCDYLDSKRKPLLTKAESYILIEEFQKTGSTVTRNKMIEHNYGLLLKISGKVIKDFKPKHVTQDELVAEGIKGMITALERFELERDIAFSTYAFLWIKQEMQRHLQGTENLIRIPIHSQNEDYSLSKLQNESKSIDKANPDVSSRMLATRQAKVAVESLDETFDDGDFKINIVDEAINVENERYQDELKSNIKNLLDSLATREQEVLTYRFGLKEDSDSMTLEEVGNIVGLTRERIRQIESAALKKLGVIAFKDASAYGRNHCGKEAEIIEAKPKMYLEKLIHKKYGCIKEFFYSCYSADKVYKDIANDFKVRRYTVIDLANKYDAGIKGWQEKQLSKAS
jgi:RNA polymerase sigma factor (sigma-70 family)